MRLQRVWMGHSHHIPKRLQLSKPTAESRRAPPRQAAPKSSAFSLIGLHGSRTARAAALYLANTFEYRSQMRSSSWCSVALLFHLLMPAGCRTSKPLLGLGDDWRSMSQF